MAADIKQVLMEKGELIALGTAGAILVGYLAVSFTLGGDAELPVFQQKVQMAQQKLTDNAAPELVKPDFSAVTAAWAPESVAAPAGQRSWVTFMAPVVKPDVKVSEGPVVPVEVERIVITPVMGAAETGLGQVSIRWTAGKPPPGKPAARATEYEIHRQEAGKGWAPLTKVAGTKTTHTDLTVEPKKKYAYKVRLLTKDKTIGDKSQSDWSQSVEATIPSGVAIIYEGGGAQAAILTVRKFMGGEWREKKYTVFPRKDDDDPAKARDGAVGKIEREKGEDGKWAEVDFRTGFVLLEIKKEKFKFIRKELRKKFDDKGTLLGEEEIEIPQERDRMKIVFLDDDGAQKELWQKAIGEEEGAE
ncbi:MAG: fibronectin type III domain-containing protein [Candidatus Brocadiae bacterium]|nr:fibronectin type III domain-containing protein [Candidatus Brocadiia bacterium]